MEGIAGLRVSNRLWLTSDPHYGHRNIIKFQQRPESHETIMLSEWIEAVGEREQILNLGDLFMGPVGNQKRWAKILRRMPGEKYLILGNHDGADPTLYEEAGFEIVEPFIFRGLAFTHYPVTELHPAPDDQEWHTNIHGHTHGNPYKPELDGNYREDKRYVNLCVEVREFKPIRLGSVAPL